MTKKWQGTLKIILSIVVIIILFVGFKAFNLYKAVVDPNVDLKDKKEVFFYIPTGSSYENVIQLLDSTTFLVNKSTFEWVAKKKNYPAKVKAGRYKITPKMSNNSLVNLLRSGNQTPVKLVFNKVRTKERLAAIIANQIEADSIKLVDLLYDEEFLASINQDKNTVMSIFIPNTYELFWNTNARRFVLRMNKEYKRFWTVERKEKAKELNLSPLEVITLASIVEEETIKSDEKSRVAGVYMNRIKKGMRLQADPTVRFAIGDFDIKRILNKHLTYQSFYNTYVYAGLPPGPICLPSVSTIDAVLNYETHKYMYFCAKEDFSGYHAFAKTLPQHKQNAVRYRKALNKRKIYR